MLHLFVHWVTASAAAMVLAAQMSSAGALLPGATGRLRLLVPSVTVPTHWNSTFGGGGGGPSPPPPPPPHAAPPSTASAAAHAIHTFTALALAARAIVVLRAVTLSAATLLKGFSSHQDRQPRARRAAGGDQGHPRLLKRRHRRDARAPERGRRSVRVRLNLRVTNASLHLTGVGDDVPGLPRTAVERRDRHRHPLVARRDGQRRRPAAAHEETAVQEAGLGQIDLEQQLIRTRRLAVVVGDRRRGHAGIDREGRGEGGVGRRRRGAGGRRRPAGAGRACDQRAAHEPCAHPAIPAEPSRHQFVTPTTSTGISMFVSVALIATRARVNPADAGMFVPSRSTEPGSVCETASA